MTREEAIEVYYGLLNQKIKEAFEVFAPELRESEDERIRKKIISAMSYYRNDGCISEYEFGECRNWLEKQPEQKSEAKLTGWVAEILRELRSIRTILENAAKEPVKEDKPLADIFEDMGKIMKESTLFEDVPKKYVPKKEDVPEVKLPFDGVGEFIPFMEAKRRLKPKTHRSVEDFCKVYGTIFRRVGNHRPEVFWNDALCDVQPREQKVRKKEERKRQKPPQEGMKQLQTWAKHYGRTLKDFNLGREVFGIPKRGSERDKRPQYAWLTPEEAEKINRLFSSLTGGDEATPNLK